MHRILLHTHRQDSFKRALPRFQSLSITTRHVHCPMIRCEVTNLSLFVSLTTSTYALRNKVMLCLSALFLIERVLRGSRRRGVAYLTTSTSIPIRRLLEANPMSLLLPLVLCTFVPVVCYDTAPSKARSIFLSDDLQSFRTHRRHLLGECSE